MELQVLLDYFIFTLCNIRTKFLFEIPFFPCVKEREVNFSKWGCTDSEKKVPTK